MELSELSAYARENYHIEEQHKWADFPGFSVLAEPNTGKWAALLMRQWDGETGTEIQRCDLKCGRECLSELRLPFLTLPFRMKGQTWVGVHFNSQTDPDVVCRLFDRAVRSVGLQGHTIVLEELRGNTAGLYRDTALPPAGKRSPGDSSPGSRFPDGRTSGDRTPGDRSSGSRFPGGRTSRDGSQGSRTSGDRSPSIMSSASLSLEGYYQEVLPLPETGGDLSFNPDPASVPAGDYLSLEIPKIPQKIRDMMRLYEYRGESLREKSRNFYRQGKFMEDYEDDAPWTGEYRRYFATYHDLHLSRLRGYFTWRTGVRRGEFRPVTTSFAYIYLYELLCGIGTGSPEDGLRKMKAFEEGFLDAGYGDPTMRRYLHRWMMDYAVVNNIPFDTVSMYGISPLTESDRKLAVLRSPEDRTEEEIFSALCFFGGKKLPQSPVVTKDEDRGKHLFAEVWRYFSAHYHYEDARNSGKEPDIFTACFGERKCVLWHPFSNAVYWTEKEPKEAKYVLNECRAYLCRGGEWQEVRYDELCFDKKRLQGLLHTADRLFRKYLKTGHYLRAKQEETWAEAGIEAVIAADLLAQKEAARPKIEIDLSGLEKIRKDAQITRDSLLTDEEVIGSEIIVSGLTEESGRSDVNDLLFSDELREFRTAGNQLTDLRSAEDFPEGKLSTENKLTEGLPEEKPPAENQLIEGLPEEKPPTENQLIQNVGTAGKTSLPADSAGEGGDVIEGLDDMHMQILRALVQDQDGEKIVREMIRDRHLMPSVVTDTINEALFDEIGDTVLECDGGTITVVEDYREDLMEILGERAS